MGYKNHQVHHAKADSSLAGHRARERAMAYRSLVMTTTASLGADLRLELGDFRFELANGLRQFRQAMDGRAMLQPLAVLHGRITGIESTRRHVAVNAALRANNRAIVHV